MSLTLLCLYLSSKIGGRWQFCFCPSGYNLAIPVEEIRALDGQLVAKTLVTDVTRLLSISLSHPLYTEKIQFYVLSN